MPIIQRMSEDVFSKIAAGEIVERPASILKELIENSLDAGALRIDIEAEHAGKKTLRVSDDGCGMDAEDCKLCLERHATSKIEILEDLESLSTFGFRGEALAAVAAVSRVSLQSALKGAKEGWQVEAEAGRIVKSSPSPAIGGTTIQVKDLFFNTPARLKFLKSDEFERARLLSVIEEAALAHPETAFSFKSEGKPRLAFESLSKKIAGPDAPRSFQKISQGRISSVLGETFSQNLITAEGEGADFNLKIFISAPGALLNNRRFQYWFVNRRPIEAKILQQALYRAYNPLRLQGKHPLCVGYLELDPKTFDVNVHPAKREIRFKNEREIFDLVLRSVSAALAQSHVPAALLGADSQNSFLNTEIPRDLAMVSETPAAYTFSKAESLPLPFASNASEATHKTQSHPDWFTPPYRYLGQIERSYLLFEAAGGLFILDQHAASECVLFERYGASLLNGRVSSERLILPVSVSLPASAVSRVMDHKERLLELGFEIEAFGKGAVQTLSTPPLLQKEKDIQEAVQKLAEDLGEASLSLSDVRRKALATIACKAAVKAHDPLSEKEAFALLDDLSHAREAQSCPHGRPTMIALNRSELARRFGRPGAPPL